MPENNTSTIHQYISTFPKETQTLLEQIRAIIKKTFPKAEETISYAIPAFKLNGRFLIYFAAFKKHIGMYPAPSGKEWEKEYEGYKTSGKGTIQFPLDKPLPTKLITKIIKARAKENAEKAGKK